MTPPLTTPFKMVPLQKSTQGLRLAYLYTCSLPASHDEGMLRKAIAEHAGTTLRHLLPDQLFIAFDEALGVVHVVTGLRERSRPSLTFANGLQRACGDDARFYINHVGKGDSLAIDAGPYACLTQRLRNANLVKTVDFDGVGVQWKAKARVHWQVVPNKTNKQDFFYQLTHFLLPALAARARGKGIRKVKRARQVF